MLVLRLGSAMSVPWAGYRCQLIHREIPTARSVVQYSAPPHVSPHLLWKTKSRYVHETVTGRH